MFVFLQLAVYSINGNGFLQYLLFSWIFSSLFHLNTCVRRLYVLVCDLQHYHTWLSASDDPSLQNGVGRWNIQEYFWHLVVHTLESLSHLHTIFSVIFFNGREGTLDFKFHWYLRFSNCILLLVCELKVWRQIFSSTVGAFLLINFSSIILSL